VYKLKMILQYVLNTKLVNGKARDPLSFFEKI